MERGGGGKGERVRGAGESEKATRMLLVRFASASLICHVKFTGIEESV